MAKPPREPSGKASGKPAVVVSIADAARDLKRLARRSADPPAQDGRGEGKDGKPVKPGKWTPNAFGLPSEKGCECPVQPLGFEGECYHLIDSSGQFRSLTASDFSHAGIQSLFAGCPHYPMWAWPRYGRAPAAKEGEPPPAPPIKSFEDDAVRQSLFRACDRRGMFSPTDKLRGRGAWPLRGGGLVYHAGEELWICEAGRIKALDTGLLQGHLYARHPSLPAPWPEDITPELNPAGKLLETFRKWNFERPLVDPVLLLGWIGVAFLGAALRWRSAVLLLGDRETGKSTLQKALYDLFGDALYRSGNTTAAGIYQHMAHDARPIAVDEAEPDETKKMQGLIELMRVAASGALMQRGGQSGTPIEYQLNSAFLFSAINNPLTSAQDMSRVAVLRLRRLDPSQERPEPIDADTCGRLLLAQLMRQWPRFEATFGAYRDALRGGGHNNRGQDTYGTLLAAADIMLGPELGDLHGVELSDNLGWWTEHLSADALPEVEDAKPNWRACLEALLTAQVDAWRNGARQTVGKCLYDLAQKSPDPNNGNFEYTLDAAKSDLELTGLCLVPAGTVAPADDGIVLAIPNAGPQVAKLFSGTPWAAGSWKDALRQCPTPGVMITDKAKNFRRVAGVQQRCTLVVMSRYDAAAES